MRRIVTGDQIAQLRNPDPFALPLWRMAHAYARLESLPGGDRIAAAMRARPDLVGGPDGVDFLLMRAAPGWLAKVGAR